tara:strand:+ start:343 stop:468 length:126 start_codon:yes stop_codon:yes gene_type:complete
MNFKEFLENQIKKGKTEWGSRSELIRFSGEKKVLILQVFFN